MEYVYQCCVCKLACGITKFLDTDMYDMYVWYLRYVDKYVWRWNEYEQSSYVDASVDLKQSNNENKFSFYYYPVGCTLRIYCLSHIKTKPKLT